MLDPKSQQTTSSAQEASQKSSPSLLQLAIAATKQTEPSKAEELMKTFIEQALAGVITYDKNLTKSFSEAVKRLDKQISKQLSAVMHNASFQKLEGSWRGLHHLVTQSETDQNLQIRVLDATKKEIIKDLTRAVEFDQSELFKKIYDEEFGIAGGEPYAALIGDYEFKSQPEDIELLNLISSVAASGFCPFIASASPNMFGLESFEELSKPRDLEKLFFSSEYVQWRSFREKHNSRFVILTIPKVLARLPYSSRTTPVETFDFEETTLDSEGRPLALKHDQFTWMSSAYVMGARLTDAFSKYGFCTMIRGVEGGGKVGNLPCYNFLSDDGDVDQQCPTEIGITDRREAELSRLGFLPLCHYKGTDYSVFFGSQTVHKPQLYDDPEATSNAAIAARLSYILAVSRFTHYLKVMARDKLGSFMSVTDCEHWLNKWIESYVNANPQASPEMRARYPLAEAKVSVSEVAGMPGSYQAIIWMKPWLQFEQLTASMRLVAQIPSSKT